MLCRAVILLQTNNLCTVVLRLKIKNILNRRASEAINTLVVITDHADILIASGEQGSKQVLQMIGVLILVDQNIAELSLIIIPHVLILLQNTDSQQNNIVKIDGVRTLEAFLVFLIEQCNAL